MRRDVTLRDLAEAIDGATAEAMDAAHEARELRRELAELRAAFDDFDRWMERVALALLGDDADIPVRMETLDRYARKLNDLREPDGTAPTQEVLAKGMDVSDRRVRQVGWEEILSRAAELQAADPG